MKYQTNSISAADDSNPARVRVAHMRLSIAAALLLFLSSCSSMNPLNWFDDDDAVDVPVELGVFEREVEMSREWRVRVGNGQGDNYTDITPVINGGVIYGASENGVVVAIELSTGNVLWRQRLRSTITGGVGAGDGLVMLGTEAAEIIALDQGNGEILWTGAVSSEVLSAPQTNGDIAVAQTVDGKLVALEASDGSLRWTYETTLPALTLRGTSQPVITPTGSVIAGFSNGTLISVDATDGVLAWEERVAIPEGQYDFDRVIDVDGDLLLDGNRILAASYQGNLMAFEINSGRIVWGLEASSYHGMDQGFGNIYYCDDESRVIAVRDNTEDVVWENEELHFRGITAPTAIGNYIAVADYEGYIHLISQVDGRLVGRFQVDSAGVRVRLLANDGLLYAFSNDGSLTALSLQ